MDPTLLPAQVGKALSFAMVHQNAHGVALLHNIEEIIDNIRGRLAGQRHLQ
jgi:hypothetical protein